MLIMRYYPNKLKNTSDRQLLLVITTNVDPFVSMLYTTVHEILYQSIMLGFFDQYIKHFIM